MDHAATIATTIPTVNSERRISPSLVAVCRLRIEPTHSTWQGSGNQGKRISTDRRLPDLCGLFGQEQDSTDLEFWGLLQPYFTALRAGADEGVRPYTNTTGSAVTWLHCSSLTSLGVAGGVADGLRIHADDFAVVADQHDFGKSSRLKFGELAFYRRNAFGGKFRQYQTRSARAQLRNTRVLACESGG